MGDGRALGVAGGARGVDDGDEAVGGEVVPALEGTGGHGVGQTRVRGVAASGVGMVHDHEDFEWGPGVVEELLPVGRQVGVLHHGQACAAVPADVADLFGGGGGVDGGGDGSGVDQGHVAEPVLGPVAHHEQGVVAGADAERGVALGEHGDGVVGLGPGEGGPVGGARFAPGQGGQIGVLPRVAQEQLGKGAVRGIVRGAGNGGHVYSWDSFLEGVT